jgi:hypothetical protein
VIGVVVFDRLHPRGGGSIPEAHHLVASGRRRGLARGRHLVEKHVGDVPVHGGLPEIGLVAIRERHLEPLRAR